jgi:hypothetical protein
MREIVVVQGAKGSLDLQAHLLHKTLGECMYCLCGIILNYKYVERFNLCIHNSVTNLSKSQNS